MNKAANDTQAKISFNVQICKWNYLELSLIYVEDEFCHNSVWRAEHFIDNGIGPFTQKWNSFK